MDISVPGVTALLDISGKESSNTDPNNLGTQDALVSCDSGHIAVRKGALHASIDGILTGISGSYYWRDLELADHAKRHGPNSTLSVAYAKYAEKLLDHIAGRFSLVIWDNKKRRGLAATDRFGQNTVYWRTDKKTVSIATSADDALSLSQLAPTISNQAIYNYLFFHMVPSPGTIYEGVYKLPAAHALRLGSGGATPFCYWQPTFSEGPGYNESVKGEEMLHLLQSAVAQLDTGETTGAFLSGGLDSSTISGLLSKAQGNPTQTFSIGFDAQGYDEMAYARTASKHFNTNANEYYVSPEDVLEILPEVAANYDEPFGNASAIPAYFCAKLAHDAGMQRLLAGDGGDELFAGNERYAKQTIFEAYRFLPMSIRRYLLEPLSRHLPHKGLPGKLSSYVQQAQIPLPDRLHTYNFLTRFSVEELFDKSFVRLLDMDQPFALERSIYDSLPDASRLNRMLYLDWHHTLADNDLRKVNRMCQLAGIEVEYPMLDDLVVELSVRVPSRQKMRFNKLRHFYKHAVRDFLPNEIINKSKHGFGLPFGVWMSNHAGLQELGQENLMRFREREILNPAFLDRLLDLHNESHPGYYGVFIWIIIMLELWLDQHSF